MKKVLRNTLLAASLALLTACGAEKLDTKTPAAFQQSLAAVTAELSMAEAIQFNQDIMTIQTANVGRIDMSRGHQAAYKEMEKMAENTMKSLHGKTAKDVHKMAEAIRAQ